MNEDLLRPYQRDLARQACAIAGEHGIVYLAFEMRVGKTLTSLATAHYLGARSVLFVTKKAAISSIERDVEALGAPFAVTVTNYESVHKHAGSYDVLIVDEAHSIGAFPKPSLRAKQLRELVEAHRVIYLSGTPTPESYSQIYHQLWITPMSPYREYKNFYAWAKVHVVPRQIRIAGGQMVNDYALAKKDLILPVLEKFTLFYTQAMAGFQGGEIEEQVEYVTANPIVHQIADALMEDRVVELGRFRYGASSAGTIVAESAASLQNKVLQIYSGTVIPEAGDDEQAPALVIDTAKAEHIARKFGSAFRKIVVFYRYKAERVVLEQAFPGSVHPTPESFNAAEDGVYLAQIQAGSMGVNLATADVLYFYNISFSAAHYWQSRARIQALERDRPAKVVWLFTRGGIEEKVYEAVLQKRSYTLSHFRQDYPQAARCKGEVA